jgi:hypothetical protein
MTDYKTYYLHPAVTAILWAVAVSAWTFALSFGTGFIKVLFWGAE